MSGLSVQKTALKIQRSKGWLSEIENNKGNSKLSEKEFNRIIRILDGDKYRPLFKTWAATEKNKNQTNKIFDGAVLKYIRIKKEIKIQDTEKLIGISVSYLSKIESGLKPVDLALRNKVMKGYGYSPSSFKNLSTDPIRSKTVPLKYKLEILLNQIGEKDIESIFDFIQNLSSRSQI